MADSENHRKRRRLPPNIKLSLGEKVEVRSVEDGFQGSWHEGEIIDCWNGCRKVKYEHLLDDNEAGNLVEIVEVSSTERIFSTPKDGNRGRIRPISSFGKVTKENLHYGRCVDCYYEEAWWEGVVFDHEDGSRKRNIFFPDIGDELISNVKNLRLTYDWDENNGDWTPRGTWLFLEVMEEYARDNFIPVSLKQIWYDLRAKEEFGEIGEWPIPVSRSLWHKLVAQVVEENFRLTVDAVVKDCDSSQAEQLKREKEGASTRVAELCENDELAMADVHNSAPTNTLISVQSKTLSVISSTHKSFGFNACPAVESEFSNSSKFDKKKRRRHSKRDLQSHDYKNLELKPEFRPQSIYEYIQADKPSQTLTNDTRRHLCFLGYKMKQCKKSRIVRYDSPQGKRFYNLRLCVHHEKKVVENSSLASEDVQSGLNSSFDDVNYTQHLKIENTSEVCSKRKKRKMVEKSSLAAEEVGSVRVSSSGDMNCTPQQLKVAKTSEVYGPNKKSKVLNLNIEPRYCPEAIPKYVRFSKGSKGSNKRYELQDEARGHLCALGWKFWPKIKNGVEEWRYDSPTTNKTYYSLMSACRAIVEGVEMHCEDPKGLSGGEISLPGKDESGYSISKKWSSKLPRALRKYKAEKFQRWKQNVSVHAMPQSKSHGLEQEDGDDGFVKQRSRQLSTTFMSKKKKALGKVKNSSRMLRSSKRARQTGPSSSSQVPRTVLSWLVDNNVVLAREKVHYYRKGDDKPTAEGRITSYGINCSCCTKVYTLSGFEAHAGSNSYKPAANIFFCKDGKSLAERQLEMMRQKMKIFSREPLERTSGQRLNSWNDHICSVCRYGGDLILCDRCPSSFHAKCLGLQDIPEGDWFCPSCCCGICGKSHFDVDKKILFCHQCERQYHASCIIEREMLNVDGDPAEQWFCCKMCEKVHWALQQLLGKPILVGHNDLTWTLMKPMDYLANDHDDCDVVAMAENHSKLRVALEVMHECFEPVKEPLTRRDLVEDVIFCRGSHLKRLNFKGFYTVLLERNDELITAAIIRVYGDQVAEIPLIGTRFKHRRLGMCRIVMDEIEKNLIKLGVKRLVLPAAASVVNTWTTAFGFTPVTDSERSEFLNYSFLDFQDTVMCQKPLRKHPSPLPQLSRNAFGVGHRALPNIEGNGITADPEGNSAISEVSLEDRFEESDTVDQGALMNVAEEKSKGDDNWQIIPIAKVSDPTDKEREECNTLQEFKEQKIERDKSEGILKFYIRKKDLQLRPPVSQANCSKVEVSCR